MIANGLLEYRGKNIKAFKDGAFLLEHLKILDAAAYIMCYHLIFLNIQTKKVPPLNTLIILPLYSSKSFACINTPSISSFSFLFLGNSKILALLLAFFLLKFCLF